MTKQARAAHGLGRFGEPGLLVLLSLSAGPRHGHSIVADIEEQFDVRLGPGTLYGSIAKLCDLGLIARSASRRTLRLYPRSWRQRYGEEVDDVLEAMAPRWVDVADLAKGATVAHTRGRPWLPVRTVAILAFVVGEVVAMRTGATVNVLRAPTTGYRTALLAATFAPLIAAEGWRLPAVRPESTS